MAFSQTQASTVVTGVVTGAIGQPKPSLQSVLELTGQGISDLHVQLYQIRERMLGPEPSRVDEARPPAVGVLNLANDLRNEVMRLNEVAKEIMAALAA